MSVPVPSKGSIAAQLRRAGTAWWVLPTSEAMDMWLGAMESLGIPPYPGLLEQRGTSADVSSEAIEAAEALGL